MFKCSFCDKWLCEDDQVSALDFCNFQLFTATNAPLDSSNIKPRVKHSTVTRTSAFRATKWVAGSVWSARYDDECLQSTDTSYF